MKHYQVMLAKKGNKEILNKKALAGFIFEPKFDGTRILIYKDGNDIELINRRGKDVTFRYPELLDIPRYINAKSCVLDSELVVLDKEGRPNFNLLQQREQLDKKILIDARSRQFPATLFVFDILEKDGKPIVDKFLRERKAILEKVITNSPFISLCPYTTDGKKLWQQIQEQEMEGVMAKELNSRYEEGKRSWAWLKIKNLNTVDAIIVGFTKGSGGREKYFGSLILAVYKNDNNIQKNKLVYIGRVGTGFDEKLLKKITNMMKRLIIEKTQEPALSEEERKKIYGKINKENVVWINPEVIAEIKYLEITKSHELRAPSFMRLRFDKKIKDCVL